MEYGNINHSGNSEKVWAWAKSDDEFDFGYWIREIWNSHKNEVISLFYDLLHVRTSDGLLCIISILNCECLKDRKCPFLSLCFWNLTPSPVGSQHLDVHRENKWRASGFTWQAVHNLISTQTMSSCTSHNIRARLLYSCPHYRPGARDRHLMGLK